MTRRNQRTLTRRALIGATAALTSAKAFAAPFDVARLGAAPVRVDRGFVRVSTGQLHYRRAAPIDATAATRAPVVCLHQTPNSSQIYVEFMASLARDRVVYAVDTPGLGESDLPATPPEISDYAIAIREFLDVLELPPVDLVGYHTGASIAAQLGSDAPERVRRLLLVGLALFNADERAGFFQQPWPKPRAQDGSHLTIEWERSFQWRGFGQSDDSVERTFIEKLSAGQTAWWPARAVMRHALAAAIENLERDALIVNTRDDLFEITPRVRALRPEFPLITDARHGFGVFEVRAATMAALARAFFDRGEVLTLPSDQ